ncbi:MAG: YceI family protein [Magnetococcales bacterium]|nr:YceI family protein [Magnetococcales bacterium]
MKLSSIVSTATLSMALTLANGSWAAPERYKLDPTHSFVTFSTGHLGYSLLHGRFNQIEGEFAIDSDKADAGSIQVTIATASVDSNFAERDKHLRSAKFLDAEKFPQATFKSRTIQEKDGIAHVEGDLTLHGVSKAVAFDARLIGSGPDPWGGFRRGYAGTLRIKRADYEISHNLGPAAAEVELGLYIEGIRQ